MQTTFLSPDEHERHQSAIHQARGLVTTHVQEATRSPGRLHAIPLDQDSCVYELEHGPLETLLAEGTITIPMIERWVMEAISHQASVHAKPLLTAKSIYQLATMAGDPSENQWTWVTLPEEVQDFYERLADLLNEALSLCASCGERKPDDVHEVAGLRLCSRCISPPEGTVC